MHDGSLTCLESSCWLLTGNHGFLGRLGIFMIWQPAALQREREIQNSKVEGAVFLVTLPQKSHQDFHHIPTGYREPRWCSVEGGYTRV